MVGAAGILHYTTFSLSLFYYKTIFLFCSFVFPSKSLMLPVPDRSLLIKEIFLSFNICTSEWTDGKKKIFIYAKWANFNLCFRFVFHFWCFVLTKPNEMKFAMHVTSTAPSRVNCTNVQLDALHRNGELFSSINSSKILKSAGEMLVGKCY